MARTPLLFCACIPGCTRDGEVCVSALPDVLGG